MTDYIQKVYFHELDLNDTFFQSLKDSYKEFEDWFKKKAEAHAYVIFDQGKIQGFLYIKEEEGPITDIEPAIECNLATKIGTLKINPHGTRLGERFIKIALDEALNNDSEVCYVTIFEEHHQLVKQFQKYGFEIKATKTSNNGTELVLMKMMTSFKQDILKDYPKINTKEVNKYLLAIYPKYHSVMFPDSILNNESKDMLQDITITNSIHKTYVARMQGLADLNVGDLLVIYRTKDSGKNAWYSSVATSICVVEDIKHQSEFSNFNDFFRFASKYSIFDRSDMNYWYNKGSCYVIQMTYNTALRRRITRQKLVEEIGISADKYSGFLELTEQQFKDIIKKGEINESIVIN